MEVSWPFQGTAAYNAVSMRIGAVNYLNSKPLVCGLDAIAPEVRLSYDLPSRLADSLAAGRLDVALIPCVEFFRTPGYTIVSDACVACQGPVLSVKLLFRVPKSFVPFASASLLPFSLLKNGFQPHRNISPVGNPCRIATDSLVLTLLIQSDECILANASAMYFEDRVRPIRLNTRIGNPESRRTMRCTRSRRSRGLPMESVSPAARLTVSLAKNESHIMSSDVDLIHDFAEKCRVEYKEEVRHEIQDFALSI